jgi:hypothetical protein
LDPISVVNYLAPPLPLQLLHVVIGHTHPHTPHLVIGIPGALVLHV